MQSDLGPTIDLESLQEIVANSSSSKISKKSICTNNFQQQAYSNTDEPTIDRNHFQQTLSNADKGLISNAPEPTIDLNYF